MSEVCEAFAALADFAASLGVKPPDETEECWEKQVDDIWLVQCNRRNREATTTTGQVVPAFMCLVTYNGWPAGLFGPRGGIIAAGDLGNEDAFIDALRAATSQSNTRIQRLGTSPLE